jgi:ABC-2 type transport system permease protein
MNALIALVRKDLVLHFSNRRAVILSVAAPILIAAFFGSLFGGVASSKPANIPIAIVDLDRSALSLKIVAAMQADAALKVHELAQDEATTRVRGGKLRAAVTLPAGFGDKAARALFGGADKPEIVLQHDPSQSMVLPLVRGLLAQHVMEQVSQAAFSGTGPLTQTMRNDVLGNATMPAEQKSELLSMFDSIARVQSRAVVAPVAASSASQPVTATATATPGFSVPFTTREVEASSNPETRYNSYAHSFAGMGVQFLLLMGVDMGVGLLLMRRQGLWKRLRAAPISRSTLLGSRIVSCALICILVFIVIYAVAMAVFGVRIDGSVIGFVAVLITFGLLTASFGLMIASLGKTPEATRGLAILVTLLMVMLGGAWVPAFIFPAWLQTLSMFVPTRWAIDGLDAMTWRGLPLQDALLPVGAMLAFTAAFAAIAIARFKWEE